MISKAKFVMDVGHGNDFKLEAYGTVDKREANLAAVSFLVKCMQMYGASFLEEVYRQAKRGRIDNYCKECGAIYDPQEKPAHACTMSDGDQEHCSQCGVPIEGYHRCLFNIEEP